MCARVQDKGVESCCGAGERARKQEGVRPRGGPARTPACPWPRWTHKDNWAAVAPVQSPNPHRTLAATASMLAGTMHSKVLGFFSRE